MGYRLDKKEISLSNAKKLANKKNASYYRKPRETIVVLKKHPDNLDEETAKLLATITTDRILLPQKILYYNNVYCGFSLNKPKNHGANKRIITMGKHNLLGEIKLLEQDAEVLSRKNILLNGIDSSNATTNSGKIILTDPTKYSKLDIYQKEELEKINKYQIHLLLTKLIVEELHKGNFTNQEIEELKQLLASKEEENSSEFIEEVLEESPTIKQFVKRI